jgi:N6-L-threonylcarbamoyladenine synthase
MKKAGSSAAPKSDVVASFQAAALEVVVRKTVGAALERGLRDVVLGGGVACNTMLRGWLGEACEEEGLNLVAPSPSLCTDNAAMVAALGYRRYVKGHRSSLEQDVYPNLRFGDPIPGS